MHKPNVIWAMLVLSCGRAFVGLGSCGKVEGDVIVITCNVVSSPPLKGRVVMVQGSRRSICTPRKSVEWVQDGGRVCGVRKKRGDKLRP